MIILIDGPEKAGKTTLITELQARTGGQIRHWGPVRSDVDYLEHLQHDSKDSGVWLWDRAWPSEHVYSKLLQRRRRLEDDPWLGEWLYGRAVVASGGLRAIMLPILSSDLCSRRTDDDLPVSAVAEIRAYSEYAKRFDFMTLYNDYDPTSIQYNADRVMKHLEENPAPRYSLPDYCGPDHPDVLVVGAKPMDSGSMAGEWLPFTSMMMTKFGRLFGTNAITRIGWANIGGVSRRLLHDTPVIACGKEARNWVADHSPVVLSMPSPAWMYRCDSDESRNATQAFQNLFSNIKEQRNV